MVRQAYWRPDRFSDYVVCSEQLFHPNKGSTKFTFDTLLCIVTEKGKEIVINDLKNENGKYTH